jgi:hypothetical protein
LVIRTVSKNDKDIAIIENSEIMITDVQSALDLLATVRYQTDCDRVIIDKSAVSEDFFDLKTRLAGEILQKFVTYDMRIAVVGDFSIYTSKSLKDFIYESNKGNHVFFVQNEDEAIERLSMV